MLPPVLILILAFYSTGTWAIRHRSFVLEGDDVLVTVENGVLRGVVAKSQNGTLYSSFQGIPFAEPPLGDLRFRAPQPAGNWSGVRDALSQSHLCPQLIFGNEDCLYLNVYVPAERGSDLLPVMFNIYGGAYTVGSTWFRAPDYFMDKEVILVTTSYRVGAIGFLSLQNADIPGNAGLKDQVFALQWVQHNIEAFSGDPRRVTIFGESAGGCSTSHLFLSPAAKGLFSGAIIESGQATATWGVEQAPREKAYRLAVSLGFQYSGTNDTDNDGQVAAFLRAVGHIDLTRDDSRALSDFEKRRLSTLAFVPVIEPPSDSAVITEPPADFLAEGRFNKVPLMTGVTSADGSIIITLSGVLRNAAVAADIRENFTALVGSQLLLPTEEQRTEAAKRINSFYFGEQGFDTDDPQAVYNMASDMFFIQPADALARTVANTSGVPVFFYYFDYDGYGASEYGMNHARETYYLFKRQFFGPNKDPNSDDGKMIELLVALWTNFAKQGEPAPNDSPVKWDSLSKGASNYLELKVEPTIHQNLLKDRMDFWREILSA